MNHPQISLPELVFLGDFGNEWKPYIEAVYEMFRRDFIQSKPRFRGRKIALKRLPLIDGKECTFYHITHKGSDEQNRIPDLRRCERIGWARPVIEECDTWELKVWPQKHGSELRICIWLEREGEPDYMVILADRKTHILLWTAFVIEYPHEKRKRQHEYDAYKKAEAAQHRRTAS